MNKANILKIVKKENKAVAGSPATYVILIVFLTLWEFLFFRNAFLISTTSLRDPFDWLPWLLLVFVSAVTMGSISKESEDGTMELVLTHPVKEIEFIIGKYLSSLLFVSLGLLFSIPIALTFAKFGKFDWGIFAAQLLGSIFFAATLSALGTFVSSVLKNQIGAFLVTATSGFLLILSGTDFVLETFPFWAAQIVSKISLITHFQNISKGVLDLKDITYFFGFIAIFLSLTYLQFIAKKFGSNKKAYSDVKVGVILISGIFALVVALGDRISLRVDLSQGRVFTLSGATKQVLGQLTDIVTVTVYSTQKLPPQSSQYLRETKDLLNDYKSRANGNLIIKTIDPSKDPVFAQEAETLGIPMIRFNTLEGQNYQSVTGYLGLAVTYAGKSEVIPVIQTTGDLEYQLTGIIKKLTVKDKKTVGIVINTANTQITEYSLLIKELENQFKLVYPDLTQEDVTLPVELSTLVIVGPTADYPPTVLSKLQAYVNEGKSLMLLMDGRQINVTESSVESTAVTANASALISSLGVTVNNDLAYDLELNETVRINNGPISYLLPYPYWLKAVTAKEQHQITSKIDTVYMPWTSSISINEDSATQSGYDIKKLLMTSSHGGISSGTANIGPDAQPENKNLGEQVLAVALQPKEGTTGKARIVVAGDSEFILDRSVQSGPSGIVFGLNAISWLTQEDSLGEIKIKAEPFGTMTFSNKNMPQLIKIGNLALAIGLPLIIGVIYISLRNKLKTGSYK